MWKFFGRNFGVHTFVWWLWSFGLSFWGFGCFWCHCCVDVGLSEGSSGMSAATSRTKYNRKKLQRKFSGFLILVFVRILTHIIYYFSNITAK
jgi:hypothetical protein